MPALTPIVSTKPTSKILRRRKSPLQPRDKCNVPRLSLHYDKELVSTSDLDPNLHQSKADADVVYHQRNNEIGSNASKTNITKGRSKTSSKKKVILINM